MSGQLHERLDAKIGELRAAGVAITRIDASPEAIAQLFADEVAHVDRLGELLAAMGDRGDRDREVQRAAAVLIRLMEAIGAGRAS